MSTPHERRAQGRPAPALTWQTVDWATLDRLRAGFLAAGPSRESYWNTREDLANYDFTYAQRIGWKWDAVLRELAWLGWSPPAGPLLDWGCGSGMAGRRVVDRFGAATFHRMRVFDRSPLATDFAAKAASDAFPGLHVERVTPSWLESLTPVGTLVVSHVLNELDAAGRQSLRGLVDRADAVLWVEPGTHADSRALIAMRETLLGEFLPIAPCPHSASCGLLTAGNERHWCHHFACPPAGLLADGNWVRFAQRAGIDLRSLPYSHLVLERRGLRSPVPGQLPAGCARVLGAPRVYKGFAKVFSCEAEGVHELELPKRQAPDVFKDFKHGKWDPWYRWNRDPRDPRDPGDASPPLTSEDVPIRCAPLQSRT